MTRFTESLARGTKVSRRIYFAKTRQQRRRGTVCVAQSVPQNKIWRGGRMSLKKTAATVLQGARLCLATLALAQFGLLGPFASSVQAHEEGRSKTPIKHVIIIVGENRTFDHIFATYQPKGGESVDNLLSKGIVNPDGTPGPNFKLSYQFSADATDGPLFQLSPKKKVLYGLLPAPLNGGPTNR